MKQAQIKTLGAAALGAAMAAGAAGSAAADPAETFEHIAGVETMSVEDSVLDLPDSLARAADATYDTVEQVEDPRGPASGPAGELLGGLPVAGDHLRGGLPTETLTSALPADARPTDVLTGALPVDALSTGTLPTDALTDSLTAGGVPTTEVVDALPLHALSADSLRAGNLPTESLSGDLPTDRLTGSLPTDRLTGALPGQAAAPADTRAVGL
ncbi:hypothetical protein, partial [Streptomyces sparsus]